MTANAGFYDLSARRINGANESMSSYRGKTVLIANTASQCGYTPQYESLEKLYKAYKDKGVVVLGFPSNDFGAQEPGSNEDIQKFCQLNYGVTFPLFQKSEVKGPNKNSVFQWLTSHAADKSDPKWNFTKFVVNSKGEVVARFESKVDPMSSEVTKLLDSLAKEKL